MNRVRLLLAHEVVQDEAEYRQEEDQGAPQHLFAGGARAVEDLDDRDDVKDQDDQAADPAERVLHPLEKIASTTTGEDDGESSEQEDGRGSNSV